MCIPRCLSQEAKKARFTSILHRNSGTNDLTIKWIDLVWKDLTMEQGDRKPIIPVFYTCTRSTHVYCFVKTDVFL